MADGDINVSPAEFQKIPLDFIIATPLLTTINAHRQAAETTLAFITKLLNKPADGNGPGGVDNLQFKMKVNEVDSTGKSVQVEREISVPLITLVKVPSLNFDSMSVSFNYNISQISKEVNT